MDSFGPRKINSMQHGIIKKEMESLWLQKRLILQQERT